MHKRNLEDKVNTLSKIYMYLERANSAGMSSFVLVFKKVCYFIVQFISNFSVYTNANYKYLEL